MPVHKFGGDGQELYTKRENNNIQFIKPSSEIIPENIVTKDYVDNKLRKCHVGFIPILEANNSITGFNVSADSTVSGYNPYGAFNNLNIDVDDNIWLSNKTKSGWLQIVCPFKVILWRIGIKARNVVGKNLNRWNIAGSNDGRSFNILLNSRETLRGDSTSPTFFNIENTTPYQYYKLTIENSSYADTSLTPTDSTPPYPRNVGIQYLQLFIYST